MVNLMPEKDIPENPDCYDDRFKINILKSTPTIQVLSEGNILLVMPELGRNRIKIHNKE